MVLALMVYSFHINSYCGIDEGFEMTEKTGKQHQARLSFNM